MRPTRAFAGAVLAAVVLHLLTRVTGSGWLSLGSGAALALPVAALLLRPRLEAVEVTRGPVRCRVGDAAEVSLVVRNAGRRSTPALRLTDTTAGLAPWVLAVPALRPGASVTATSARQAVGRSRASHGSAELSSAAPFGLVRVARRCELAGEVVVAPARTGAPVVVAGGEGAGERSRPVAGEGTEVLGLRPFRSGDGLRAVHARASARHGRPVVLERERDSGPALVLLCLGAGSGPGWEAAVAQSCALAEAAVRAGRPPELLAAGLPAPGRYGMTAVLEWHAGLDAATAADAALLAAAGRAAARGGALVVLAPAPEAVGAVRAVATSSGARLTVLGVA